MISVNYVQLYLSESLWVIWKNLIITLSFIDKLLIGIY